MAQQRFVISARVIGSVHRDTPKLKMFMVSVLWSDEAEVIIYRSFQEFKKFHRSLKKKFPHLNPLSKKDKMIPKFRGKAIRSSLPKKGSKKSIQRMKFLESYCIKLLKCDPSVTQSSELTRFFNPNNNDLQPDFTKNSVMILLSDIHSDGGDGVTHQPASNITHPCITQTYCCVASYETKDTKNRPFKVALEEKLEVLIKDPSGWWLAENEEKRLAWFPAPYLDLWEGDDNDESTGHQLGGTLYCAVRGYTSKNDDEVSVSIGTVVEVLRKSDNGWWLIRCNGKAGYIPSMYLQPYNNPRAGLYSIQSKIHSSTLNLATTSRGSQALLPPSISEDINTDNDMVVPTRRETGRLHKAQSLDVLSEPWSQTQMERVRQTPPVNDPRRLSRTSAATSFSDFSTSSDSSLHPNSPDTSQQPDDLSLSSQYSSNNSSELLESVSTKAASGPRVPPRPKTEEILTRCTTMTRKAAMATKTRIQPDYVHSR